MSLYGNFNVTIHHQWESLFTLYIILKFQTNNCDYSSLDNSNSNGEKNNHNNRFNANT
jgi:hypothetical protein